MTLHSLTQYLLYKWKAKTRHGVHSPFVYDFIDRGLRNSHSRSLKEILESYFGKQAIIYIDEKPDQWQSTLFNHIGAISDEQLIAIKNIHRTKAHTEMWRHIKDDNRVKLSIDLFEYGLLFFRKDFKEKQHFIIK